MTKSVRTICISVPQSKFWESPSPVIYTHGYSLDEEARTAEPLHPRLTRVALECLQPGVNDCVFLHTLQHPALAIISISTVDLAT